MTHKEEVIRLLTILKDSLKSTVGNRIDKEQSYTILSNIPPDSFKFVIDAAIGELAPMSKTGLHWIERFDKDDKWLECPHCHRNSDNAYNYCPNCGAEMEK